MIADFPNTAQLFGAYLHQDWPDEYGDEGAAVRAMILDEPRETVKAAARELRMLLNEGRSEQDLRSLTIDVLGCYLEPAALQMTYGQWLDRTASRFENA